MPETLKGTFDRIMEERQLTQKPVIAAIGLGAGTFAGWRKDPDSASDVTLKKIRNFTENPDRFLSVGKKARGKPRVRTGTKQPKGVEVTAEMLRAFAETDPADLAFVGQVLGILGLSSLPLSQVSQLIELRHKEISKT